MYKMKRMLAVVVSCVMMNLFFVGCGANSVDFQGAYDYALEQCKSRYEGGEWDDTYFTSRCSITSDGSCIKIDLDCNYEDIADQVSADKFDAYKEAYATLAAELCKAQFNTDVENAFIFVQDINNYLELSEAVYESMGQTSGLDGKQSIEENGVIVTWKYKNNDYFNVMYTKAQ